MGRTLSPVNRESGALLPHQPHGVAVTIRRMNAEGHFGHIAGAQDILAADFQRVVTRRRLQRAGETFGNPDRLDVLPDLADPAA